VEKKSFRAEEDWRAQGADDSGDNRKKRHERRLYLGSGSKGKGRKGSSATEIQQQFGKATVHTETEGRGFSGVGGGEV